MGIILTDMRLDDKLVIFECACTKVTIVLIVVIERLAQNILKKDKKKGSISHESRFGNARLTKQ